MNFNSILFLVFLFSVVCIQLTIPSRIRHVFLLLASIVAIGFYSIESALAVVLFSTFNFYLSKNLAKKKGVYVLGIAINISAILLFNYFIKSENGLHFFISTIHFNLNSFIIALGLSFYSLQNISYLTEVYSERMKPEKSLSAYILYCSFFPKVISGPVLFPKDFFPQVNNAKITKERLISGFQLLLLGLFKKMVIADRLSPAVDSIFDFGSNYSGLTTIVGAYLFTIQLYFDFSGYTDMALGMAKMLGYDLKENFNFPLRSTSVSEFWRRWHISLITWFTNYIYYPVVYKFRSLKKIAALIGILFTFIISALWHGIGFTFLAWAICHIVYLSFEILTKKIRQRQSEKINSILYKTLSVFIVFNIVCFSNIFFRAESMQIAIQMISNTVHFSNFMPQRWLVDFVAPLAVGGHQMDVFNFLVSILIMLIVIVFERKIKAIAISEKFNVSFVVSCVLGIMVFGIFDIGKRFIYMQF